GDARVSPPRPTGSTWPPGWRQAARARQGRDAAGRQCVHADIPAVRPRELGPPAVAAWRAGASLVRARRVLPHFPPAGVLPGLGGIVVLGTEQPEPEPVQVALVYRQLVPGLVLLVRLVGKGVDVGPSHPDQ